MSKGTSKERLIESFMLGEPSYDLTPPPPIPSSKLMQYNLDPNRNSQHRFQASFLANAKPLLIGCDVGLPVDQLILFAHQYNCPSSQMHPDDQALIKETIMDSSQPLS